jgi:molybdopterin molybdotransferase
MWFGTRDERQMVFALPGNPVSTLVCLHRYVLPALCASQGCRQDPRPRISLAEAVSSSPGMTCFVPVKLGPDTQGRLQASPRQTNTSGDFSSLAGTQGFVELPAGQDQYPAGYLADFYPWAA